jgi:hypothetical protein
VELNVADEVVPTTVYAVYKSGRVKPIWTGLASHDPLGHAVSSSPVGDPSSRASSTGSTGSTGHAPDTGSVNLAGTSDSSVTVVAGADYVSTGLQDPERLTPEQHKILREDFVKLLKGRKDCMEFAKRLLLTAASNTGRALYDNSFLDDPVKIFDAIEKQGGVALDPGSTYGGSASGTLDDDDRLEATMKLKEVIWGGKSFVRGEAVFHEAAHFAPANGIFTDRELAWAGYEVLYSMGYTLPPPPSTADAVANSRYFQFELIFRACNPYQHRK